MAARLLALWLVALVVGGAVSGTRADEASTRIGERLYVVLWQHDPLQFSNALRAADDFLGARSGRRFEIIMDYYGMFAAIPGVTVVQREYVEIKRRRPGLSVIVCKETFDKLSKANKRRLPVLPGMQVTTCKDRRKRLEEAGWREALGF